VKITRRTAVQLLAGAGAAMYLPRAFGQAADSAPAAPATHPANFPGGFELSLRVDPQLFAEPPRICRQQGFMSLNIATATEANMTTQVQRSAQQDLTGGFYLGMYPGSTAGLSDEYLRGSGRQRNDAGTAYLSEAYFSLYAKVIEAGLKNGNPPLVFYDEVAYPSGMAGGYLYSRYPQYAAKSLEKVERDVTGPAAGAQLQIPDGITVGAVMMNLESHELLDISDKIGADRKLSCDVPAGKWKLMGFYLNPRASLNQGSKSGYVDYLDPEAVKAYIDLNYQSHYDHLKQYFGTVLKITQYDEPALHSANGKAWTPRFNEGFEKLYGYNPMKYYPALWYDIGPDTAAMRNALWGYRAKLFAESYIKQLDDWCRAHDIIFSGHQDQEEIANPVAVSGDRMLAFKYQQAPGIDDIWWWGRSNRSYKLISSAAYNWDHPICLAETYAGYRQMNPQLVYRVAMDQVAMGTNFQDGAVPRSKTPQSDRFIGRLCYLLQHGRHVSDVAILYPIASLQAAYRIGDWTGTPGTGGMEVSYASEGGIVPPEIDYIELGELVFRGLRQDFTFLHPDALQERCLVQGRKLVLNNPVNREEYSVLIVPGGNVLSVESARKIKAFYDAGGTVIATRLLARQAAEKSGQEEVRQIIDEVFGLPENEPMTAQMSRRLDEFLVYFVHRNNAGGRAYFLPGYTPASFQAVMREAIAVPDVAFAEPMWPVIIGPDYAGSLTYTHKVKDGRDIYFFANSSDKPLDTNVTLRGNVNVKIWDPMSGKIRPVDLAHTRNASGQDVTTAPLKLDPVTAVFFVAEP